MSGNCIAITDPAFRLHAPLLCTLGLADYGILKDVFNQAGPVSSRRVSSGWLCWSKSKAASQHADALQQRFILVVKIEKCYLERATFARRGRGISRQRNDNVLD